MAATWRLFYAGDPGDDLYCEPQRFGLTDKDCDRLARWYAESSDGDPAGQNRSAPAELTRPRRRRYRSPVSNARIMNRRIRPVNPGARPPTFVMLTRNRYAPKSWHADV